MGRTSTFSTGEPYVGPRMVFLLKYTRVLCYTGLTQKVDFVHFNKPAHHGGAVIKLHLVMVRGSEKEIFSSNGGIPHHAQRHSSLLDAHGAQDEKVIHCTLLQVILHL